MNRSLVFIGIGGVLLVGAAVVVNKSLMKPEEQVVDVSHVDTTRNLFKRTSDDPSTEIKFAWKQSNAMLKNPSPLVTVTIGLSQMSDENGTINWELFPTFKNFSGSTYDQITVVPLVVQEDTLDILCEGKPLQIKDFSNDRWLVKGPMGPHTTGTSASFMFPAPSYTWRPDSYVTLAIVSVNRLSLSEKVEYPWELYQMMLEDPALAMRTIKKDPSLLKLESPHKTTPLMMAIASGDIPLANAVASAGGKWDARNDLGMNALMYAAMSDSPEMLDLVSAHVEPLTDKDRQETTPIAKAADLSLNESVLWLARHKQKINQKNKDGLTPLMVAAERADAKAMYILIKEGADVNIGDKFDQSAYIWCNGDYTCMQLLYDAGLSCDKEDPTTFMSPIQDAARRQNYEGVYWYLNHGQKLKTKNSQGKDSVEFAKESNTLHTDRFLNEHLADPQQKSDYADWLKTYGAWKKTIDDWAASGFKGNP